MSETAELFPTTGIHKYVTYYIQGLPNLTGKHVLDIPCGDGRSSHLFTEKGATVTALDLFPQFIKTSLATAEFADLAERLPVDDGSVDYVICQEGIEHVSNQLEVLQEFNRLLKPEGTLILTTPNMSNLRARLAYFFTESDHWKRMPPTEVDSIWFASEQADKMYFGHLFLLGVQKLESLLVLSGFEVTQRLSTKITTTSVLLGVVTYPWLVLMTLLSYRLYKPKNSHVSKAERTRVFWQRVRLNLSPTTLFCKHIFWEIKKKQDFLETQTYLQQLQRDTKE